MHNLSSARQQDVPLRMHSFQLDVSTVPSTALLEYTTADTITKAYQQIVGSLLYVASWTRPDILYAVVALAQCTCSQRRVFWDTWQAHVTGVWIMGVGSGQTLWGIVMLTGLLIRQTDTAYLGMRSLCFLDLFLGPVPNKKPLHYPLQKQSTWQ